MAENPDGIQRLLAAEQEAQAIIAKARKGKAERLRQAKEEAEKELAVFKAEREELYKKKVSEGSSSSDANLSKLTTEAEAAIKTVQDSVKAKKQAVLDMLTGYVGNVQFVK